MKEFRRHRGRGGISAERRVCVSGLRRSMEAMVSNREYVMCCTHSGMNAHARGTLDFNNKRLSNTAVCITGSSVDEKSSECDTTADRGRKTYIFVLRTIHPIRMHHSPHAHFGPRKHVHRYRKLTRSPMRLRFFFRASLLRLFMHSRVSDSTNTHEFAGNR